MLALRAILSRSKALCHHWTHWRGVAFVRDGPVEFDARVPLPNATEPEKAARAHQTGALVRPS
jgi:hypothetical protein